LHGIMAWKADGKANGKGKSGGKGHLKPRTRITAEKFTGFCTTWKGKFGWITPSEPVDHPKAHLRNGDLFVGTGDLEGASELTPGAPCEFHIWEDEEGLGADEVIETGAPVPGKAKGGCKGKSSWDAKGAGKAFPANAAGKAPPKVLVDWSAPASAGAWGAGKASTPSWGSGKGKESWNSSKASAPAWDSGKGKASAWDSGKGKDKGKGKAKGKGGSGHKLPRTRVSAEKFTGTVGAWKGKFGWIKPDEPIEHDKASAHKGDLFVSKADLEGIEELTEGAMVEFHIFEDTGGLGAEEVIQY